MMHHGRAAWMTVRVLLFNLNDVTLGVFFFFLFNRLAIFGGCDLNIRRIAGVPRCGRAAAAARVPRGNARAQWRGEEGLSGGCRL